MQLEKSKQEEFLDRFTERVIEIRASQLLKKKKEEREEERRKKAIAVAKLKEKFSKYEEKPKVEEKKEEPKPVIIPEKIIEEKPKVEEPKPVIMEKTIVLQPKPIEKKPAPEKIIKIISIPIPPKQPPIQPGEADFGKITFLIKDPLVTYIECPGPDKNIIIRRAGVTTKTQITLTKEEILATIKSFSEKARIPLIEGMLKARIANLEMSAVVSEKTNSSFIVKKIIIPDMEKQISQLQRPMMQIPTMPGVPNRPLPPQKPMPPINRPFPQQQIPPQKQ